MTGKFDRALCTVVLGLLLAGGGAVGQGTPTAMPAATDTTDWDSLRRPLDLPSLAAGVPCPRTEGKRVTRLFAVGLGNGPLYPVGLGPDGVLNYKDLGAREDGGWYYAKVLWAASPDYGGPFLVRGRQIDGPNELRFGRGANPPAELRLAGGEKSAPGGWRGFPSYTRIRAPGCYAYQVDGDDFSEAIVFQAVEERPEELTPLPSSTPLPRGLFARSGVRLGTDQVRLAFYGDKNLMLRLDVWPTQDSSLELRGQGLHRLDTTVGAVLWQADAEHGWPAVATWDDGRHRYRLEVLDGDPGAWSQADLVTLVEAFAAAPEPGER